MTENIVYDVKNLTKHFTLKSGVIGGKVTVVRAVNGLSFQIREGETLGLVGESGCGKSTTGRLLIKLLDPTGGQILYNGRDIAPLRGGALRRMRAEMQIVFQDPYSSLNPRMTCEALIAEPLTIHTKMTRAERKEAVQALLRNVGLPPQYTDRYPHEFSGGQRQRIGIARALALKPRFVVCDEPVSALDVSVQSQVLNLIRKLQAEMGLTYLFIAHSLNVVKYISDRIGVMYLGSIVELASSEELYRHPLHPYTQSLISAIPDPDNIDGAHERIILQGDVPSPSNLPSGCPFHTRCRYCKPLCTEETPVQEEAAPGHFVACHIVTSQ
jgi:oligopeptide/dipeptide ABC transporter ATP-binding protein